MSIEVIVPLVLAIGFSYLRCFVDIQKSTNVRTRACHSGTFFLYVLMVIVGNSVTTFLALGILREQLPDGLQFMLPFFSPFAGVFAFESVLKHANITVYGKGALTIEEWITKARDNAEARANAKEVQLITREQLDAAYKLKELPENELNTHVAYYLGAQVIEQLEAAAQQAQADPALYKAMTLASDKPENVRAILQTVRVNRALGKPPHSHS